MSNAMTNDSEKNINYVQMGKTIECGHCNPEKYGEGLKLAEKSIPNYKCDCQCHLTKQSSMQCEHISDGIVHTSERIPRMRCIKCRHLVPDTSGFTHQPPVREEWIERFEKTFDQGRVRDAGGNGYIQAYATSVKDYVRSERLAAQREILKMILEKKEMVTCNNCNEQCINGDIGYYVYASDIEDIGKGLGV
jgi:hypothetical protein